MATLDPGAWKRRRLITVRETEGIARELEAVDIAFTMDRCPVVEIPRELRLARREGGAAVEVTAQFYEVRRSGDTVTGRVAFLLSLPARGVAHFELLCGNPGVRPASDHTGLHHRKLDGGPQHRMIENQALRVETLPTSGQIWHMWNKLGTNTSWHHHEWSANVGKGGDPCHWSPNCWVAHPERVTNGYELPEGGEIDFIDWNYVFGWKDPECVVETGPVFVQVTRRGVVWPHPEHSRPQIQRDRIPRLRAEVTYRFYDGLPWIHQSSTLETLEDMNVFFIRNCQFVFLTHVFTHMIIAPDDAGLLPGDRRDVAVMRLMGNANFKPYDWIQHSLSNILPPSPAWYSYYNDTTADGFALFPLREANSNRFSGAPVYQNHATLLTEIHGWAMAAQRTFSYTNQRYNAENVTYLPKGERYEEENCLMVYRHEGLESTVDRLDSAQRRHQRPVEVVIESGPD